MIDTANDALKRSQHYLESATVCRAPSGNGCFGVWSDRPRLVRLTCWGTSMHIAVLCTTVQEYNGDDWPVEHSTHLLRMGLSEP
jgi:hypothetical protein